MRRIFLATLVMACAAQTASASIYYSLDAGNTPALGTGPYGTVVVDLTGSTTASITLTNFYVDPHFLYGDGGTLGLNVNATSWLLGAITGSNAHSGFIPGPYSDGGAGNEDGFGSFNQTINSFDGFGHSSTDVTLTLTNTSGTWASAADVLIANSNGNFTAAHVYPANGDYTATATQTGFAAADSYSPGPPPPNESPVPEAASLIVWSLLIGSGSFIGARRRRSADVL
jgi:hypothetical protein